MDIGNFQKKIVNARNKILVTKQFSDIMIESPRENYSVNESIPNSLIQLLLKYSPKNSSITKISEMQDKKYKAILRIRKDFCAFIQKHFLK